MQIRIFPMGPLETNCYLIYSDTQAIVVDPGGPPDALLSFLEKEGLSLTHILLTHLHFDHTYGVHPLVAATGAKVMASEKDGFMLQSEMGLGGMWGTPPATKFSYTNIGEGALALGIGTCNVLATPGHSPGGLSFYFAELGAVCSGDSLFHRSIGRTDLAGGDEKTLFASIRGQLFSLPEETVVYPGHGPSSTIGDEKRNNPYSSDFILV